MRITSGGNVGIGTASPLQKLDVFSTSTQDGIQVNAGTYPQVVLTKSSVIKAYLAIAGTAGGYGTGTLLDSLILRAESGNIHLTNSSAPVLTVTGGNVGIGTTSPVGADGSSVTVQLKNTVVLQNVVGIQALFANNAYYDNSWKRVSASGAVAAMRINADTGENGISFHVAPAGSANSVISNWDSSDIKMRINNSGNVLIGTTTSTGAKLEVNGDIRTGVLDTGYVSGFWKLGRAVVGTQPANTHQIIVEINGALYVIPAASL